MRRLAIFSSFFFIFLSLALLYVYFADTQTSIVVQIDPYRDQNLLGGRNTVLRIAVAGLALIIINIFIGLLLQKNHRPFNALLILATVIFSVLILIVISVIIKINSF